MPSKSSFTSQKEAFNLVTQVEANLTSQVEAIQIDLVPFSQVSLVPFDLAILAAFATCKLKVGKASVESDTEGSPSVLDPSLVGTCNSSCPVLSLCVF